MVSSNNAQDKYGAWLADQIAKSEFFRQKLHEYGLLKVGLSGISPSQGVGLPNLLGATREEPEQVRDSAMPTMQTETQNHKILAAVEIKSGIDTAGVLERVGAAIKSLSRAKIESADAITILIMYRVAMTDQAQQDLKSHEGDIDHWFTIEDVLNRADKREEIFRLLGI